MKLVRSRFWIALAAGALLTFGACSGDDTGGSENANDTEQNQLDGDGDGDRPDAGDGDVGDVEPGDGDADQDGDGDEDGDDEEELIFEDVDPVECAYPSDDPSCDDGDFGPASFITRLEIAPDDSCCADVSGDGEIDNLLGPLVAALATTPLGNVNENLEEAIHDGQLAYLLEASHWVHPQWDASLELAIHEAGASMSSAAQNLAGEGAFLVRPWGIVDGTGIRRFTFQNAYVHDGKLVASGGTFQIRFPGLIDAIDARMENVSLEATVVQTPAPELTSGGGFALSEGRLGGAIIRDALFESMNEAAEDCECMGDEVVLYFYEEASDRWYCGLKTEDEAACMGGTQECEMLATRQLCLALAGISSVADVEFEGQRAFSVGIYIDSVTTEIVGVHDPN